MKDFDAGTRLYQIGVGDFPPLRTPGSVDLPIPATRFLGREHELFAAISLVYERDPRLLTILGPGGTGKTRFVIELARLLAEEAEGGTVFVPLAALRDPELVLPAIAERLGAGSADAAAVAARVGGRRTHVVVDNAEHLLPGAARPLAELAATVPTLRLVVTSREALRVQGEAELDLPPLVSDEAVALFCERAQAVRPELSATETVAELCERLDRLPLALELAAARTKLLTPEQLLERLGHRLDALKGTRDADARHATMRATIAWSHDLLDEDEKRLFARLSVFRGGCTLETAEAVCDASLDPLGSLLDKSLLRRRTGRLGEERYSMLESIRQFASERLEGSGEPEDVRVATPSTCSRSCALRTCVRGHRPRRASVRPGSRGIDDVREALDGRSRPTSCSPPSLRQARDAARHDGSTRAAAVDGGAPGNEVSLPPELRRGFCGRAAPS